MSESNYQLDNAKHGRNLPQVADDRVVAGISEPRAPGLGRFLPDGLRRNDPEF
jgi:hypothetical protein